MRLTISSGFLSCTGANAWERTFPADRSFRLTQTGGRCVAGYRAENATNIPMAFWVGRRGGDAQWWTLMPGESMRFNSTDGAYIMATTAEALRVCSPNTMYRHVFVENLTPPNVQVTPRPMVRYTQAGGGDFTIYRDRDMWMMFQLYEYPNYFGVGLNAGPTAKEGWVGPFNPMTKGGIPPVTYTEIECPPP